MKRTDVIAKVREFVIEHDDITAAYLFGSLASGNENPMSDIDIALLMPVANSDDIISSIKRFSYAIADILNTSKLDLVSLRDSDLALRYNVIRHGILFFERYPVERIAFERKTTSEYLDMLPLWAVYDSHLKMRLQGRVPSD